METNAKIIPIKDYSEELFQEIRGELDDDRNFFESLIHHALNFFGISLKSKQGKELFLEIVMPDIRRAEKNFANPEKKRNTLDFFGKYNQNVFFENLDEFTQNLAEIYQLGLNKQCLKPDIPPFWVSISFFHSIQELYYTISSKEIRASANFFRKAHEKYLFSPIELIIAKNLHFAARRIYFLQMTDPLIPYQRIKEMRFELTEKVENLIDLIRPITIKQRTENGKNLKKLYRKLFDLADSIQ